MSQPNRRSLPDWQLPDGVSRGAWEYVQSQSIASDYDVFHQSHPLPSFDRGVVQSVIEHVKGLASDCEDGAGLRIVDFGCGTGRSILPLAAQHHQVIGIDLSRPMLERLQEKASEQGVSVRTVQANMSQWNELTSGGLEEGINHIVLCLFSSLGMVALRENRVRVLENARRLLRAEGRFVVHVHNRGNWLLYPSRWGIAWRSFVSAFRSRSKRAAMETEYGDRIYPYRNISRFFLHIYSASELVFELRHAGFEVERWIWLDSHSAGELPCRWFLPRLRSGGMIVIGRPTTNSCQAEKES